MKRSQFLGLSALVLSTAALVASAEPTPNDPEDRDSLIPCLACVKTGQLDRERSYEDAGCRATYGDDAPRLLYKGRCVRYQCLIGYYYAFEGWFPTSTCTADVLNDPDTCPNGTCLPLPFIPDINTSGQSCSVNRVPSSGAMTKAYASQLVKNALEDHGAK